FDPRVDRQTLLKHAETVVALRVGVQFRRASSRDPSVVHLRIANWSSLATTMNAGGADCGTTSGRIHSSTFVYSTPMKSGLVSLVTSGTSEKVSIAPALAPTIPTRVGTIPKSAAWSRTYFSAARPSADARDRIPGISRSM